MFYSTNLSLMYSKCLWVQISNHLHQVPHICLPVALWAFNSILFWVQSSLSFSSPCEKLKELLITTLIVFQFWSSWIMLCILDIFGDLCCEMLNLWQIRVRASWSSQWSHGDGGPMLWVVAWQWKFQVMNSWS